MRRDATFSMILSRREKAALEAVATSMERTRSDAVRLLVRQAAQDLTRLPAGSVPHQSTGHET
jgi:hypothetical protein